MRANKYLWALAPYLLAVFLAQAKPTQDENAASVQLWQSINQTRAETCGALKHKASSKLNWNATLAQVAKIQAIELAERGSLSHQSESGASLSQRVSNAGYKWAAIAENLAQVNGSANHALALWMNSPPHKSNLCNPKYREIGVHTIDGFWVTVFASRLK